VLLGTPLLYRLLTPVLANAGGGTALRVALSAGGPMPADTADVTAALGTPVRQIYGTTEAGLIACVPAGVTTWPAGSVGFAAPGVTLQIDDAGRLSVRAPMMFPGYYGMGTRDGFYDTGDLVRLDAAGHLFVLGRKEGVVNIGGRKVSPQRVERVLLDHTGVRDAYVFGVERADHEQEMHAALVLTPGTRVEEVLRFCRTRSLRPYEVPHRVHPLDRLPRNGMGKVDRRRLEQAIATHTTEK
jgi:acyl-coenzyme A synthetase/AMP-(fatty) acid ligase